MARTPKLKVYRTAIGFHDAYVAVPSKKAALAAWGSDSDLFAWEAAELVDDPALAEEPLAQPGTIIKRPRGTSAEHLAALPDTPPPSARTTKAVPAKPSSPKKPPRPDRTPLAAAEQALTDAEERHAAEHRDLRDREAALNRERRAMEKAHATERERLDRDRKRARTAYDAAMSAWRD